MHPTAYPDAPYPPSSAPPSSSTAPSVRGPAGTGPRGPAGPRPAGGPRPTGRSRPSPRRPRAGRHLRGAGVVAPDPHVLAVAFGTWFLEVESGRRSRDQLEHLLDPLLYATLAPAWVRPGPPGCVLAATGTRTAPDRYDAVLVVRRGIRVGALAVGLHRRDDRWRVARAARPEDGVLPPPPYLVADDEPDVFDLVGGCPPLDELCRPDAAATAGSGCPTGRPRAGLHLVGTGGVG